MPFFKKTEKLKIGANNVDLDQKAASQGCALFAFLFSMKAVYSALAHMFPFFFNPSFAECLAHKASYIKEANSSLLQQALKVNPFACNTMEYKYH